jgi:predicted transcriptional regulator
MSLAYDKYDLAETKLKAFTRSAVRSKVMLCLLGGELNAGELEMEMSLRATTILHCLKELSEEKLVTKRDHGYRLTNIGRIQAMILEELIGTVVVMDRHWNFWMIHDLSDIPAKLQMNLGMLVQCQLIKSDPTSLLKSHEHFLAEITRSKNIRSILPVIAPGQMEVTTRAVEDGARVELILTPAVHSAMLKECSDLLKGSHQSDNFHLYVLRKEIKIALTVTDSLISLGLYRLDDGYDLGNELFCEKETSRAWGNELFNYYLNQSTLVKSLADF